ncbi:Succinate dehydrogenase [ubiquinone] cytochrome b small subunit, mitochondrial [Colletotrichum chlorophyti]|uniref:Succinate dehydrogenase [ubiquinone] cytochrome b small subunit n=1 Tax=Colletotrichum chlorophyti TaxID=708187 RepID=A0A1Q8REZ1_9PEZI|nr:Succinate dehydrogenase [ubiquinone] cytochrome b small subunit, mitochondrial [Colletotrichum chlorophyti]
MASFMRPAAMAARMAKTAPIRSAFVKSSFQKEFVNKSTRVAAFHNTAKRDLLPQGPLNDPAPVPPPSPAHGSYHWSFDRVLAAGLVPITITPFAAGSLNPTTDAILCALILIHSHTGFQNILIDYVSIRTYPKLRKATMWALNLATALVGLGLYEFETSDVGVTEAVARLWRA